MTVLGARGGDRPGCLNRTFCLATTSDPNKHLIHQMRTSAKEECQQTEQRIRERKGVDTYPTLKGNLILSPYPPHPYRWYQILISEILLAETRGGGFLGQFVEPIRPHNQLCAPVFPSFGPEGFCRV